MSVCTKDAPFEFDRPEAGLMCHPDAYVLNDAKEGTLAYYCPNCRCKFTVKRAMRIVRFLMVADIAADTVGEAQDILDAFRESSNPNDAGVSLYRTNKPVEGFNDEGVSVSTDDE